MGRDEELARKRSILLDENTRHQIGGSGRRHCGQMFCIRKMRTHSTKCQRNSTKLTLYVSHCKRKEAQVVRIPRETSPYKATKTHSLQALRVLFPHVVSAILASP